MKQLITIISILFILQTVLFGQSARMVLIEEGTNASCPPCASQNPGFDALLNQNRDVLTAIKYHWYFPGYDPMHNHNVEENNARVAYYGISGVPTAAIDGDIPNGSTFSYPGSPAGYRQSLIDQYAAIPSPFEISMSHFISADQDSIYIDMMIVCTEAVTGSLVAHMVVVEKEINFTSPPGSNGEKDFLDVMKKMLPNQYGSDIPNSFDAGDYIILQESWELKNIYNMDMLGVVGFIQNNADKNVQQAACSSADPLSPIYNTEATITDIMNIPEYSCLGTVVPEVEIRNNGADALTSLDINYHVNGEELHTHSWSGNLDFLESTIVSLPEIAFTVEEMNDLVVYTSNPNGSTDEYIKNDTMHFAIERAIIAPTILKFTIRTDDNPEENRWEILDSEGNMVHSGGPYTDPNTMISEDIEIYEEDCYLFKIYDTGGDGFILPGFYALYFGSIQYIATGTDFGSIDTAYFSVSTGTGLSDYNSNLKIQVFPNPVQDNLYIETFLAEPANVVLSVIDVTGSNLIQKNFGSQQNGPQKFSVSTSGLTEEFISYG